MDYWVPLSLANWTTELSWHLKLIPRSATILLHDISSSTFDLNSWLHVKYKPDSLSSWFIRLNLGWAKLTNKLGVYIFFLKYSTYCTNSLSDYRYRIWMWMASKSLKYINHETKCNKLIGLLFLWSQFFLYFLYSFT